MAATSGYRTLETAVTQAEADELSRRAEEAGTSVSVIAAGILARYAHILKDLGPAAGGRPVLVAVVVPIGLDRILRAAALDLGASDDQVAASAISHAIGASERPGIKVIERSTAGR